MDDDPCWGTMVIYHIHTDLKTYIIHSFWHLPFTHSPIRWNTIYRSECPHLRDVRSYVRPKCYVRNPRDHVPCRHTQPHPWRYRLCPPRIQHIQLLRRRTPSFDRPPEHLHFQIHHHTPCPIRQGSGIFPNDPQSGYYHQQGELANGIGVLIRQTMWPRSHPIEEDATYRWLSAWVQ